MKKMKYTIFSIAMVLFLASCNSHADPSGDNSGPKESKAPDNENFTLIDPTDTSMVSSK